MANPGERIPREVLLHEVSRALRASFPDRAEPLIRELEKRLTREVPETMRRGSAAVTIDLADQGAAGVAQAVIALVDNVERHLPAGPRLRWGVRFTPAGGTNARLEVRAVPAHGNKR